MGICLLKQTASGAQSVTSPSKIEGFREFEADLSALFMGGSKMYDVVIVGAGPGGIFTAYELLEKRPNLSIAVFEMGNELTKRHCPIDGDKVKSCIHCKNCSIMSGFGGAGAFSDGKYNITNDFGGTLYEYIGKKLH